MILWDASELTWGREAPRHHRGQRKEESEEKCTKDMGACSSCRKSRI